METRGIQPKANEIGGYEAATINLDKDKDEEKMWRQCLYEGTTTIQDTKPTRGHNYRTMDLQ
ncbi:unnamed protein product [Arabis nemorensis]|uniref:Uncharacterized protein n=1 Tax=Arabis nemorensis TaxID=586526 RepID=A0A565ATF4_9BRAS|nr:unnamed protein product [Arabis nemorensis]